MLYVLVLAALAVSPGSAPLVDLPPGADPCIALTPAVVDRLRTSGALTPLVPDEIPTALLIATGRSLSGCPPTGDPDPAAVQRHVCPLLTPEGVGVLADRFRATPAVRADLGPERIAIARDALQCDDAVATAAGATPAGLSDEAGNTPDRADDGPLRDQEPAVIPLVAAVVALIGVLLLMVLLRSQRRRREDPTGASRHPRALRSPPEAAGPGRPRTPDARGRGEGREPATPAGGSDMPGRSENRDDSYDELLEGLRREVTQLRRADEDSRRPSPEREAEDER